MAKYERRRRIPSPRRGESGQELAESRAEAARWRTASGKGSRAEREVEGAGGGRTAREEQVHPAAQSKRCPVT